MIHFLRNSAGNLILSLFLEKINPLVPIIIETEETYLPAFKAVTRA